MNTKKSLAFVSTSALAAGMAHGGITYSGPLNLQQNLGSDDPNVRQPVDMTGDSTPDFTFGYEFGTVWNGVVTPNVQKPYVDVRTTVSTGIPVQSGMVEVLGKANTGFPVTPLGTMIDASYVTTYPPLLTGGRGYFYQAGDGSSVVGDWSGTAITEGYVGIELDPGDGTHYGWLHFIDNPTTNPNSLTLVDYAYENTPDVGIEAGAVPEPCVGAVAALGLAGLLASRRQR